MKRYLLSFDLSSSVVGYSIFDIELAFLVKIDYFIFPKNLKSIIEKGLFLENKINEIMLAHNEIVDFVIEENLKGFQAGKSSANVILTLNAINSICQFIMFKKGIKVNLLEVKHARNLCFPGFYKISNLYKGMKEKDIAFDFAIKEFGKEFFPTKIVSKGVNKGHKEYLEEGKDMADSWILGKAFLLESYGISKVSK